MTPVKIEARRETLVQLGWERWRTLLTFAAYIILCASTGFIQILRETRLSPFDEAAHIDYAWKASGNTLPFPGSKISPEVLDSWSCHGQKNAPLPPCGSDAPATSYPAQGENYLMHPPTFYAITGYLARALLALPPVDDFVVAARIASLAWLAIGMIALHLALRAWGISWGISAPLAALPLTLNLTFQTSASLNNDATATLAGAAAVYLASRLLYRKQYGLLVPGLITIFIVSTKVLNAIPLLGIAAALVIAAFLNRKTDAAWPKWQALPPALAILFSTVVVHASWSLYRSHTQVDGWSSPVSGVNTRPIDGTVLGRWAETAFDGLRGAAYGIAPENVDRAFNMPWVEFLSPILLGSMFAAAAIFSRKDGRFYLPIGAIIGMIGLPLAVQLQVYFITSGDYYFPAISSRYSLSLLPVLIACAALTLEEKGGRWMAWSASLVGIALTFAAISLG